MAASAARRVVVVVWDGMRPDFVSAENTPNLWQLAQRGVFFAHHHPVYVSATEVNGTAIATGAYPEHSQIIANKEYRPSINPLEATNTEKPVNVRKGDQLTSGHYLERPTIAEILHAHDIRTAIAGSKQVALLHDRSERGADASPIVFEGIAMPAALGQQDHAVAGTFPVIAKDKNKTERDAWTTGVLIASLWRDDVPAYSLLWLAEPDASQHATGPGSTQSLAAIKSSDTNLGRVIAELERRQLLDTTDILVVSDHGFSTIERRVNVAAVLTAAGLEVRRTMKATEHGNVLAVGNGGSTLFYITNHDPETTKRLVSLLQQQPWSGVIFSREQIEGTFPLDEAHIHSPEAADVVLSLHWSEKPNSLAIPGLVIADSGSDSDTGGTHASLSRFDMHNTLIAAGPDFQRGIRTTIASANTDVAPTILWCLGLKAEAGKMDGRVLTEALAIEAPALRSNETKHLTAERRLDGGVWRQYLDVTDVNGVRYLDEGNGRWEKREELKD
jgi:predicted AlkP superfamily pyrophosphatase or phosphodiesterase